MSQETSTTREVVDLLASCVAVIRVLGSGMDFEGSVVQAQSLSMFSRARELVESTHLLIDGRCPSAAFILQRPLFEISVVLAEIARSDAPKKERLIARWMHESNNASKGLAHRMMDESVYQELGMQLKAQTDSRRSAVDRWMSRRNIHLAPPFNYEAMGEATGRAVDLVVYRFSHQAVHTNRGLHGSW